MVSIIEENKIKNDFLNELKKKTFSKLKIKEIVPIPKNEFRGDLTKLISCSQNYYEDLIKIYIDNERVIEFSDELNNNSNNKNELNNNYSLNISGSGILYIIIKKNIHLNLIMNSNDTSFIFIKIFVQDGMHLNLSEYSNSKKLFKNMNIILGKKSKLNYSQFIFNSKLNSNLIRLSENSEYKLKSMYNIDNSYLFLENKSLHIGENSISNMNISGIGIGKSNIINDGRIIIEKNALNSIAHQKLKNLIIDKDTKIMSDPILEVKNSRVECSHGSSVSNIDEEILFYMNSKGISNNLAKKLIIDGLFFEVLDNIESNKIKEEIINYRN